MTFFKENKDLPLKFLCKILFNEIGYSVYLEVKLRTKSYMQTFKVHDVSDIDVFGFKFQPDMTLWTAGAECKSGDSGALEELYKFIGVKDYFNLSKGYFVKSKIHQNARQIAYEKDVSCFSEAELRKLLLGCSADVEKRLKIEAAKYNKLIQLIGGFRKHNEELIDYLIYDFWNRENWKNIHSIIHLLSLTQKGDLFSGSNIPFKMFHYYVLEFFSFAVLKNVSSAMMVNYSDIDDAVKNSLYGGAEALREKQKIYDQVNLALQEDTTFSPEWESDFIKMSSRFASQPKDSSRIPHLLNNIRENAFFKDKVVLKHSILKPYSSLTRKFTQDLIHFVSSASNIPKETFQEFMHL